jgi:hypothetical protein
MSDDEVPDVEVTTDKPVTIPHLTVVRRSGARNVSDAKLQAAFIDEARHAMGQPGLKDVEELLGQRVLLVFNVDWPAVEGVLTDVVTHPSAGTPNLILDGYRERVYPLNAIQRIEVLDG